MALFLQFSQRVLSWLQRSLKECPNERCQLSFLRTFRNLHHASEWIEVVASHVSAKSKKVALSAIKALRLVPPRSLPVSVIDNLWATFENLKMDSSVRIMAFEILVRSKPDKPSLNRFVAQLRNESVEFAAFCVNRMLEYGKGDSYLQTLIR